VKQLYVPALIINLMMFLCGLVIGANPQSVTVTNPGGYVLQLNFAALLWGLLGAVVGIAVAISVQVLGSGVGATGQFVVVRVVIFGTVWFVFSTVTLSFLNAIPLVGFYIYLVLSVFYGIGVFLEIAEGAGSVGGEIKSGTDGGGGGGGGQSK